MLLDYSYTFGLLLEPPGLTEVFRKGTPCDLFYLTLDPPLGRYSLYTLMHVRDHEHVIPTKFCKNLLSGSVIKADYEFPYIYMH